jgi:hypothetical protein
MKNHEVVRKIPELVCSLRQKGMTVEIGLA